MEIHDIETLREALKSGKHFEVGHELLFSILRTLDRVKEVLDTEHFEINTYGEGDSGKLVSVQSAQEALDGGTEQQRERYYEEERVKHTRIDYDTARDDVFCLECGGFLGDEGYCPTFLAIKNEWHDYQDKQRALRRRR